MMKRLSFLILFALAPVLASAQGLPIKDGNTGTLADVMSLAGGNPLMCAIVDTAGAQIGSFGGGTQYTEADTDASITGTALMWEDAADTLRAVSAAKPLPVDGSGVTQPVSGTVTVTDGAGALNTIVDSGTLTCNAGTGTFATDPSDEDARILGRTKIHDGTDTALVSGSGALNVTCDNCGAPPTFEDEDAFTVGTTAISNIGFLVDETTPDSAPEDSAAAARMSLNRNIYTQIRDGSAERSAAVTASNALKVDGSAVTQPISAASLPLPTGAATAALQTQPGVDIGDVTINNAAGASAVNIQDGGNSITVDGTVAVSSLPALVAGTANIGDVDVLTFPDNEPFNVAQIAGTAPAAHDAAMSGDAVPLTIAGFSETPEDSDANTSANRVSADADKVRQAFNRYGVAYTNPCHGPWKWTYHEDSSSALTDTTVHASCGTGLYNYICSIAASTSAATAFTLKIEDGTTTTILGPYALEAVAGRGFDVHFEGGKRQTTSATLVSVTTTGAVAHGIDIQGYCAP